MGMVEALTGWARRSSSWQETQDAFPETTQSPPEPRVGPIYRLRRWPELPQSLRTADVLRLLSLMSNRPISRSWMENYSKVPPQRLLALLERLKSQDALEEVNP